jgi:hypothetical protein
VVVFRALPIPDLFVAATAQADRREVERAASDAGHVSSRNARTAVGKSKNRGPTELMRHAGVASRRTGRHDGTDGNPGYRAMTESGRFPCLDEF